MAVTAHGWFISMTLVDGAQQKSTVTLQLRGTTNAEAETSAAAVSAAYAALTNSVLVGYHVIKKFSVDGADPTAATSLNAIQAALTASVYNNPLKAVSMAIVNPVDGMFQSTSPGSPGYNQVDLTYGALGTYVGLFKNSAGVDGGYVSDGESVLALTNGIRVSRSRRSP